MRERGHSLAEVVVVLGIIVVVGVFSFPAMRAYSVEAHLLGAGRKFKGNFRLAHSMAVRSNVYTAIRFERRPEGMFYSLYRDGNANGVLSADIAAGRDARIAGPFPLDGGAPGVEVGILPGVSEIPPDTGILDPGDPIRFGRSDILSFSPLGTATPGTFYLAGEGIQAGVRVTGTTARVRLMVWRGGRWGERT